MTTPLAIRLAALVMFLAIALGAFGAHGLADRLEQTGRAANWDTAVLYHLAHGVALFALALATGGRPAPAFWLWVAGIVIFSGSLYLLAVTGKTWLGAITPIGGLSFLAGWAWLLLAPPRV